MLKKYLLYVLCGSLFGLGGCNKDEEEITTPTYADQDWFMIPDKPGEFNQLVYRIYTETGMPIFVNDTLGEEYYAKDAAGNPLLRVESFNLSYMLFGDPGTVTQSTRYVVQSRDTAVMIKAVKLLRERVLPYVPREGVGHPRCIFLVDSLNDVASLVTWMGTIEPYPKKNLPVYLATKGLVVGQLCDIKKMSEEEIDLWCGRVIAGKLTKWLMEGNVNLTEWSNITKEAVNGMSVDYFSPYWGMLGQMQYYADLLQVGGMFTHHAKNEISMTLMTCSREDDVREYVARVYAYRGREQEFHAKYAGYDKVLRKFDMMREYVVAFEKKFNLQVK